MFRRHVEGEVRAALADTPVVLIHGARQTGKTTLARSLAEEVEDGKSPARSYFTLDDATVLAAASSNPEGFIAGLGGPVVIDEVQRAPGLFLAIKAAVDRQRQPGRFLLTGSANVLTIPRLAEALAGRMQIATLWPLSQSEIEGRRSGPLGFVDWLFEPGEAAAPGPGEAGRPLMDRLLAGGYPEPLARPTADRRDAWHASHLTTILQRDVRELSHIEGLTDLPRLLALMAARTSGLLNFADLSRGMAAPVSTIKRYFALLESTFLVTLLPAWASNQNLRLTKSPKVVLTDSGLACHLLGMDGARLKADGQARGMLLESFVTMEIMKQAAWSREKPRLHHFRTSAGKEVDLVLEDRAGRLAGVEVRSGGSVSGSDFGGLRALREASGGHLARGVVLYDGDQIVPFEDRLLAMPIRSIWADGKLAS